MFFHTKNFEISTLLIKGQMNNEKNQILNFQFLTHQPPLGGLSDFKNDCVKYLFLNF
jgi:hypothetical protein